MIAFNTSFLCLYNSRKISKFLYLQVSNSKSNFFFCSQVKKKNKIDYANAHKNQKSLRVVSTGPSFENNFKIPKKKRNILKKFSFNKNVATRNFFVNTIVHFL